MTAILTTLLLALPAGSDDPTPRTRSHNLHSEILLTLHTNNIISEAIKKFGISNTTSAVLIVRFGDGEQEEVWTMWSRGSLLRCRRWTEGSWSIGRRWIRYVRTQSICPRAPRLMYTTANMVLPAHG